MFVGLDFGTSSSAIGIRTDLGTELVSLYSDEKFIPSTLYTFDKSFICEFIDRRISGQSQKTFRDERRVQLNQAARARNSEGFSQDEPVIFFGNSALQHYTETPEEGTFIKSPKSFLGATGLSEIQVNFFEDLVSAMMLNIKNLAEKNLDEELSRVVIGRPVNFQGVDSEQSNRQAIQIMERAAHRCGYSEVEFLYEPLAAGVDFESQLNQDKTVLVVDIGGGTTDCSMVKMGPSYVKNIDRTEDFLAHTGRRVGGNDIDIALSYHQLMVLFGKDSFKKNHISVANGPYWSAVSINNIAEQSRFNSLEMVTSLQQLKRNAQHPKLIERLIQLQAHKLNYRVVRTAELAKIALSDSIDFDCDLEYIQSELRRKVTQSQFCEAISTPLEAIKKLISECVKQSAILPELVYITGGSAKSPVVRKTISEVLPNITILDGDYYGSVAAGLSKWANMIWR